MNQRPEDLSVQAERSQDSGDQLSPVAEDSAKESHFRPGETVDRWKRRRPGHAVRKQIFRHQTCPHAVLSVEVHDQRHVLPAHSKNTCAMQA